MTIARRCGCRYGKLAVVRRRLIRCDSTIFVVGWWWWWWLVEMTMLIVKTIQISNHSLLIKKFFLFVSKNNVRPELLH